VRARIISVLSTIYGGKPCEPSNCEKTEIIIAGYIGAGTIVNDIDIAGLWDRFIKIEPLINHQIEEKSYELDIEE